MKRGYRYLGSIENGSVHGLLPLQDQNEIKLLSPEWSILRTFGPVPVDSQQ